MLKTLPLVAALLLLLPAQAIAEPRAGFHTGPVFTTFGHIAPVESDLPIPEGTVFRVVFDVTDKATPGQLNRTRRRLPNRLPGPICCPVSACPCRP